MKKRLDWGKPALTIIDVRSRVLFDLNHILGSVSMPMDEPADLTISSLELNRDLYVYADTNKRRW